MGHDITDAPGELDAVVSPDSFAPVAVAAGLRGQQVEQRVAVPGIVPADAFGCDPLMKQGTGPLHGHEHRVVALDPGDVVGPAAPFHVEAPVLCPQLLDHFSQPDLVRRLGPCAPRCVIGTEVGSPGGRFHGRPQTGAARGIR